MTKSYFLQSSEIYKRNKKKKKLTLKCTVNFEKKQGSILPKQFLALVHFKRDMSGIKCIIA